MMVAFPPQLSSSFSRAERALLLLCLLYPRESQLRYFWEFHEAPPSGTQPQETMVVRMINAEALYGYEYLGNSGRLVITPLTVRPHSSAV